MARPVQFPPTIHHHRASGQARIRVGGQDIYLGPYGSLQAQARYAEVLAEMVRTGRQGPTEARPAAPALLVCEVVNRFLAHAESYYSARGRELAQFKQTVRPLVRLFGTLPARSFDADCLRQLQQAMLDGSWLREDERHHHMRPTEGGWSRRVTNARTRRIRTMWRWAEETKLVPPGSWQALRVVQPVRANRPGARDPKKVRSTTLAEVKAVCRHLRPMLRALLLVQFWTGMRTGEVRMMRACDLDTSGAVWTYQPRQHKTDYLGHARVIILGPRARAALRPWLEEARARGEDAPIWPSAGNWRGPAGAPLGESAYCQALRRAARKAGLLHFHAYLCRHAARMRVSREAGDEAARAVLGQRHLDITLSYGELDAGLARDVQSRLG